MSISLSGQLLSLAAGLLLGVGVGLLYDLLRQLRLLAPRRWMAEGLDLLFWLLACLALFLCGILFGGGQVRLYMVLWLTLGATAYFAVLSGKMRRLLAALAQGIGNIFRVLLAPLRWLYAVLLAPWIYFFGDAKIFLKKVFSFSAVSSKMYHLVKPSNTAARPDPLATEPKKGRHPLMFRSKPVGLLLKILCLILVVYMALTFLHVRRQISDTKNTIETLTQQVNDQTQTNTELSNAIENRDDPSYIEDIAREKLGLVTSNDRVFYITD